jgi:hypothetical protein
MLEIAGVKGNLMTRGDGVFENGKIVAAWNVEKKEVCHGKIRFNFDLRPNAYPWHTPPNADYDHAAGDSELGRGTVRNFRHGQRDRFREFRPSGQL